MKLESPAFENHKPIPKRFAHDEGDLSPPLVFRDLPRGTQSLVLIMDDPDAPMGTFDHWIAWNISPETKTLQEGAPLDHQGKNGYKKLGYGGPFPPPGYPHRYFFKAYALDIELELSEGSIKKQVEQAMEGHILGQAELIGTYENF